MMIFLDVAEEMSVLVLTQSRDTYMVSSKITKCQSNNHEVESGLAHLKSDCFHLKTKSLSTNGLKVIRIYRPIEILVGRGHELYEYS